MDIYPAYASQVAFYAIGQDPTESLDDLEKTRLERGYTWPVAKPDREMLADLRVLQESTKIAFDGAGVIVYRRRGGGDVGAWSGVFQKLADGGAR